MESDWASLPCGLLVDIFRRLGSTAFVRCAGTCRPWRRAIIGNASCLRPRADSFLPDLLLAFFHGPRSGNHDDAPLQYVAGPLKDTLDLEAGLKTAAGCDISIVYNKPLSSRDGFLLLGGRNYNMMHICLCNPLTGSCRFLPVAAIRSCMYVLATGYDDEDLLASGGGPGDGSAVSILAMELEENGFGCYEARRSFMYQVFSSKSGRWGPVKYTAKSKERMAHTGPGDVVVCRGSIIHWLVRVCTTTEGDDRRGARRTCTFAMDLRTERTWITELPEKHAAVPVHYLYTLVLATSEDGRLSLVALPEGHRVIEVWVLAVAGDGDQGSWTLRRTIELHDLPPDHPSLGCIKLGGFCPRSGCLFGMVDGEDLHFGICVGGHDGGSLRYVQRSDRSFGCPYEMDWSTYLSKMKYF